MNSVVLTGRLATDPDLRTSTSGKEVVRFTLAVDRKYSKDKEREADFTTIVAWDNTATFVSRYFHKGNGIAIKGELRTRNYEDKNGNKRTSVEVYANEVEFNGSNSNNATAANTPNTASQTPPAPAAAPASAANYGTNNAKLDTIFAGAEMRDDLPF